jgi:hypothetical protein
VICSLRELTHPVAWNTGTIPHSSFSLPGEDMLSVIRNQLQDIDELGREAVCTPANELELKQAYAESTSKQSLGLDMEAQIGAALGFRNRVCEGRASKADLQFMLEYLTRASLEIRCVTLVIPKDVVHNLKLAFAAVLVCVGVTVAYALASGGGIRPRSRSLSDIKKKQQHKTG